MDKNIDKMLEEEIKAQIENLSNLESGSEQKMQAVDDLAKLYKLSIEEKRLQADSEEKSADAQDKERQIREQKKDRWVRIGIAVAELILPLAFYGRWMKRGFEFEKEGAYTSTTFRGLFSKFKPTKK